MLAIAFQDQDMRHALRWASAFAGVKGPDFYEAGLEALTLLHVHCYLKVMQDQSLVMKAAAAAK